MWCREEFGFWVPLWIELGEWESTWIAGPIIKKLTIFCSSQYTSILKMKQSRVTITIYFYIKLPLKSTMRMHVEGSNDPGIELRYVHPSWTSSQTTLISYVNVYALDFWFYEHLLCHLCLWRHMLAFKKENVKKPNLI